MEMTSVQEERRAGGLQAKVLNYVAYYYADLLFEEGKISKKII